MRHRIYLHLCWTTRKRTPLITLEVANFLARYIPTIARQERARLVALGIVTTHVHAILRVHPQSDIPRLIQRLKGGSSRLAAVEGHTRTTSPLVWSKGYNLESVSFKALGRAINYVTQQANHHPKEAIVGWHGIGEYDVASATR
jgi:putative transposase